MKHIKKRPNSLRIMGRQYGVRWVPLNELGQAHVGLCMNSKLEIVVQDGQHPVEELDTLLHELFHAIWFQMSINEHDAEEEVIVRKMAGGLTQVLMDNSHLQDYIRAINNPVPSTEVEDAI